MCGVQVDVICMGELQLRITEGLMPSTIAAMSMNGLKLEPACR